MARPVHLEPRTRRFCRGLFRGMILGGLAWIALSALAFVLGVGL